MKRSSCGANLRRLIIYAHLSLRVIARGERMSTTCKQSMMVYSMETIVKRIFYG